MDYVIICDGMTIAKFETESDRDLCLDTLIEAYGDEYAFTTEATEATEASDG